MLNTITPLYLLEKNVSIPIITIVIGIGELPWALKFIWGGIIDFYHKYGRKKFTVFGTILGAIGFLILVLIDQNFSIIFFTLFLFFGHIGVGFLDAAADAWVIDITKKKERGKINASMKIGRSLGAKIGGVTLIVVAVNYGYDIAFLIACFMILIIAIIPLLARYTYRKIETVELWPILKNEFNKTSTKRTTLYLILATFNPGLLVPLIIIFAKTVLNIDTSLIAIINVSMLMAVIPGSILSGLMVDKYGRKITQYIFLTSIMVLSAALIFVDNLYILILILGLFNFSWNGMTVANWSKLMDITNPKIGASQFSIIASMINLGNVGIGAIAGTLVILIGFQNIFILAAILSIITISSLYYIKDEKGKILES